MGENEPTWFVADIGANHDGSLERAKDLISLAKGSGADAVKFQNFRAPKIVSRYGFESLGGKLAHQAAWKKSVYDTYQDASVPWDWTPHLKSYCDKVGIVYLSTPYDLEAVNMLDPYVDAFKIGSGDITWTEMLEKVASKGKPVMLSTGASDMADVQRAMMVIRSRNRQLVLMQCNTNYTGSTENYRHINLNVLRTYGVMFPDVVLGLSDHTPTSSTVLGAIALGARVIEKHFTDDNTREGPDHKFALTPDSWKAMVQAARELEMALGSAEKLVAENERESLVVQRRCLRASKDIKAGTTITETMVEALRPAPADGIPPYQLDQVVGKKLRRDMLAGQHFSWGILD